MREDGRTLRLFRGRRANFYSPPLGSPIWGFTAHWGFDIPVLCLAVYVCVNLL
jgi:hypothetical protein